LLKRLLGSPAQDPETAEQARTSLAKTRASWRERFASVLGPVDITDATWDELEVQLIQADMGVATATEVVAETRALARDAGVRRASELSGAMRHVLVSALQQPAQGSEKLNSPTVAKPLVILMVGVNGTGKTTTIAKLAMRERLAGKRVVLIAADTFRAAAIEQLQEWGARAGVPVLAGQAGSDPAAVTFDALSSRTVAEADVVFVDTAGRLHTQPNLMAELVKIRKVCGRVIEGAPHATVLVLDATTGQNGLVQARAFLDAVEVSAVALAKLDSTAKGGVAFAVTRELGVPIQWIGTGEALQDLVPFDAEAYVDGLLGAGAPA
jgi:fused signal recognition particle receptor